MVSEVLRTDIPNDWNVITLGDYAQIFRGGSPRPIQAFLTTSDQGINWIKIGDVGAGEKFIETTEEKIIPEGVSRSRMVYKGDLILSNSMSYGRPYIMNIEGCIHDGWLVIQKYDRLFNREYLYYALSSDLTMRQYVAMAAGSSVQNLNKEKVSKVVLPCPKISEQKKIAEVLSSIDALIVDLQKLIRKKKDIRQGTTQMLVTGKKRLDGFDGEWVKINLSKNSKLKARIGWQGLTTAEYLDEGYSYLITGTDFKDGQINWNGCHYVDYNRYEQDPNIQVSNGDLLLTKDGTIGKVAYEPDMRKMIDNYITAADAEKIGDFDDLTLLDFAAKQGETLTGEGDTGHKESAAEAIENNIRRKVIEKVTVNPRYYAKMSEILDKLIEERKQGVLDYAQMLEKYIKLAKNVDCPEENEKYPESIRKSKALMAIYDNTGEDEKFAIKIYKAVKKQALSGFRDNQTLVRRVKKALFEILGDDSEVERVYKIIEKQEEF